MRSLSLRLSLLSMVVPSVACASGAALYEQLPINGDPSMQALSQEFGDAADFNIIAADDFTVPAGPGWNVESLASFFSTGNGSGLDADGIRWTIWADVGGQPGAEVLNVLGGAYDVNTGLADADLTALGNEVELSPGSYWFGSQIIGDISTFGQEFQLGSNDGGGSLNFLWNNPGGGLGLPTGWVDANGTINPGNGNPFSDVTNLAFSIGGSIVPEPATLGLLALGGFALVFRRKNAR